VIVPVRPIPDVLASFEKLYRASATSRQIPGEMENYFQFQSVEGRCDYLMQPNGVVGLAQIRIADAIRRGLADRLLFVEFDRLTQAPEAVIRGIYEFLGEPYYPHDCENVEQVTREDDAIHGYDNMHRIRKKVRPVPKEARKILGDDLVQKYMPARCAWADCAAA
jgi:sulfotransferase